MAVSLSSFLIPSNGGKFFLLEDIYLRGGFRIVPTAEARNTMHASVKKPRMVVITADDGKVWQLQPDNKTWTEFRTKTDYFPFHTHDQPEPAETWVVEHYRDTPYLMYTLFDDGGYQIHPDEVVQIDWNVLEFRFNSPVAGHATLSFAEQS